MYQINDILIFPKKTVSPKNIQENSHGVGVRVDIHKDQVNFIHLKNESLKQTKNMHFFDNDIDIKETYIGKIPKVHIQSTLPF